MAETLKVDIVSNEASLFSGDASRVAVSGSMGELGIHPGHTPLLTTLKPGQIVITLPDGEEQIFYVQSGFLEVQPHQATILADVATAAGDINEAAAVEARERAERMMQERGDSFDYTRAAAELAQAAAMIRTVQQLRKTVK